VTEERVTRSPRVADRSLCLLPTDVTGRRVSDVRRCMSMQRLVCQQTQFELDALWDGKPVEALSQHVLDMILLLGADD